MRIYKLLILLLLFIPTVSFGATYVTEAEYLYEVSTFSGVLTENKQVSGANFCSNSTVYIYKNPTLITDGGIYDGMTTGDFLTTQSGTQDYSDIKTAYGSGYYFFLGINSSGCNAVNNNSSYAYVYIDNNGVPNYMGQVTPYSNQLTSISQNYNTRFLSIDAQGTNQSIEMTGEIFLDTSEYNVTNRPDTIMVQIFSGETNKRVALKKQLILPLQNGTSSYQIYVQTNDLDEQLSSNPLPDGIYEITMHFWSLNNQNFTFINSTARVQINISSGDITSVINPEITDGRNYGDNTIYTPEICGITAISGCIVNAVYKLFVPNPESFKKVTNLFSESTFPFVSNIYNSYQQITDAVNNPSSTDVLSYNLTIPEANIDVEMFSVATIENLMGDTKSVFRSLALLVLMLGFLTMVINSINKTLFFTEYLTKK